MNAKKVAKAKTLFIKARRLNEYTVTPKDIQMKLAINVNQVNTFILYSFLSLLMSDSVNIKYCSCSYGLKVGLKTMSLLNKQIISHLAEVRRQSSLI